MLADEERCGGASAGAGNQSSEESGEMDVDADDRNSILKALYLFNDEMPTNFKASDEMLARMCSDFLDNGYETMQDICDVCSLLIVPRGPVHKEVYMEEMKNLYAALPSFHCFGGFWYLLNFIEKNFGK